MLEFTGAIGYPGRLCVADINLSIGVGEGVCLIGQNGTGKTTLLLTLAGLIASREGTPRVKNIDVTTDEARKYIGFLPDPPGIYEELSPREHLELIGRLWKAPQPEGRLQELIAEVSLEGFLDEYCFALSLGQRKRLAMACTLYHRPPLLLLDEPFNGLDAKTTRAMVRMLGNHREAGGSFIVSTHQPEFLEPVASRLIILEEGGVHSDGDFTLGTVDRFVETT